MFYENFRSISFELYKKKSSFQLLLIKVKKIPTNKLEVES